MESVHEEWRAIPGYEGQYEASSLGRVRSLTRQVKMKNQFGDFYAERKGTVLARRVSNRGYLKIVLNGKEKKTHQAVAWAFLGPCPPGLEINHKDGDKGNNRPENLEYVTRGQNIRHSFRTGLRSMEGVVRRGADQWGAKLNDDKVLEIRQRYAAGETGKSLAIEFGVCTQTIVDIVNNHHWKHVAAVEKNPFRRSGTRNHAAVLTDELAETILIRYRDGELRNHIAKSLGVSWTIVDKLVRGETWKHVHAKLAG